MLAGILAAALVPVVSRADAPPCAESFVTANRSSFYGCRRANEGRKNVPQDDRSELEALRRVLGIARQPLSLEGPLVRRGLATRTSRFRQTYAGLPVFGAWLSVTRGTDGAIRSIHSAYRDVVEAPASAQPIVDATAAGKIARIALGGARLRSPSRATLGWRRATDGRLHLAWRLSVFPLEPFGDFVIFVDALTGEVLEKQDRTARDIGSALVYFPNPVQQTGDLSLRDFGDAPEERLSAARTRVLLQGLDPGTGLLRGAFVDLVSLSGGLAAPHADEPGRIYDYDRNDPRFEEVVVYHAIDSVQRYIHDLGFDDDSGEPNGIRDRPTLVQAHWDVVDQSFYSLADDAIYLGTGGVDDGEDAEIVVHEYGHAIQHDQNPCWGAGETRAMGEGFGDYLAAGFFAEDGDPDYLAHNRACVAEWDATVYSTTSPPCLRRVDRGKRYPDDLIGDIHLDGEIWSRALWDLRSALSARVADQLILEHHFTLPCDAQMPDAAREILAADTALFDAEHQSVIRSVFCARGILAAPECGPVPALALAMSISPTRVIAGDEVEYAIVVTNRSAASISDILVRSEIPTGATYVAGSASDDGRTEGQAIVWPRFALLPGAATVRRARVRIDAELAPDVIFVDDIETPSPSWQVEDSGAWHWRLESTKPRSGIQHWFADDPAGVSDQRLVLTIPASLPPNAVMRFYHAYDFENGFDGGVIEISVDGEDWIDAQPRITQGGYTSTIHPAFGSPIAGRRAYTGLSSGYVETVVDLGDLAGQSLAVRFRATSDANVAGGGWALDDVEAVIEERIESRATVEAPGQPTNEITLTNPVRAPACGDGLVQGARGEQCDDGNRRGGDCCSAACLFEAAGSSCEDGNACNGEETCNGAGVCRSGTALACDDGNSCTDDACDAINGCRFTPHSRSCSDGDPCNGEERCSNGTCLPGDPLVCDDDNPCTDDTCLPRVGCAFTSNDSPCGGDLCFAPGLCRDGTCSGDPLLACDDGNPCTDDICDGSVGCVHRPNTASCDDGNPCNGGEHCAQGICRAGAPLECDDGNPCTDDVCESPNGCVHLANTASCDDGDVCNGNERCFEGTCRKGTSLDCDDSNPCTDDLCNRNLGCVFLPRDAACSDGDICSHEDRCVEGRCVADDASRLEAGFVVFALRSNASELVISARLPRGGLGGASPDQAAFDIVLLEPPLKPVYFGRLPAGSLRDVTGRGRRFRYRAPADGAGSNGIRSMRIRREPDTGRARIRIRAQPASTAIADVERVSLTIAVNGGTVACTTAASLPCEGTSSRRRCSRTVSMRTR